MDTETSQKVTSSAARDREETQSQKKQRASLREERMQELSKNRTWQEIELSNAKKGLDKLRRDIAKLQKKIDKEESEQSAKCGWRGFVSSYITKKEGKPEEKKTERGRHQLDRRVILSAGRSTWDAPQSGIGASPNSCPTAPDFAVGIST